MGKMLRRTFLLGSAAIAGGVAVGFYIYHTPYSNPLVADESKGEGIFNPFIKITADSSVTIIVPRAEMGQGVVTTLAALVAEELDIELQDVNTEFAPAAKVYYNRAMLEEGAPFQVFDNSFIAELTRDIQGVVAKFLAMQATGGSSSTFDAFDRMRTAGAAARAMLIAAAADNWDVVAASLKTKNGKVIDPALGRSMSYGELVGGAITQTIPENLALKDASDWRYLGKSQPRLDMRAKVTGKAGFGIDVRLPDMLFATVRMNPHQGARMTGLDASEAEKIPGVIKVIHLGTGYGVVANNTWVAFKAADLVKAEWAPATYPATTAAIFDKLDAGLKAGGGFNMRDDGDAPGAIAAASGKVISARYTAPYLAHATMEPMNATAQWTDGKLTVWCGNQAPTSIVTQVASVFGLSRDDVTVHSTYLGGGFGRRFETDFSMLAARVAKETDGRPVQVTWSREEDMQHDMYRPGAICEASAVVDANSVTAIEFRAASQSAIASVFGRIAGAITPPGNDRTLVDGLWDQPYALDNYRVTGIPVDMDIPVGFWRAVGHSHNPFFHECFLDEIARSVNQDPLEYRLKLMQPFPVAVAVMQAVREMSGWAGPLPADDVKSRGRGVAFCLSFGTWVAQVVQVADTDDGIRIEKVWCAADFGIALDPKNLEAQMMSGIIFGLSAAIGQEITFDGGAVEQGNFDTYDAMRMNQAPDIEVRVLQASGKMGGAGEPGTPPSLPALANAVFAATGKRIRQLPLSKEISFA